MDECHARYGIDSELKDFWCVRYVRSLFCGMNQRVGAVTAFKRAGGGGKPEFAAPGSCNCAETKGTGLLCHVIAIQSKNLQSSTAMTL